MADISNHTRTRFPKIYGDTWWGNNSNIAQNDIIIENRNKFAVEYQLKSSLSKIARKYKEKEGVFKDLNEIKSYKKSIHDDKWSFLNNRDERREHIEYYKTKDNKIIAVFSPCDTSESKTKITMECGYSLIYPIYSTWANTFVKTING